jgi:hypothetical protein
VEMELDLGETADQLFARGIQRHGAENMR